MTLRDFRSFADQTASSSPQVPGWFYVSGSLSYPAGRWGAGSFAMRCDGGSGVDYIPPTVVGEAFFGFALQSSSDQLFMRLSDSTGVQLSFTRVHADGTLVVQRGGTTIATSATGLLGSGAWNYLEFRVLIADASGRVEVKCNGATVIDFTGDTRNGSGTAPLSKLNFWHNNTNQMTDFYFCDSDGSAPYNTFLGDVRVELLPVNGNGSSSQFVGSDGNSTDNYLLVDERPISATDYAGSATVGQKDLYALTDTALTGTVLAVKASAQGLKSDSGAATMAVKLKQNAVEATGAATALAVTNAPLANLLTTTAPDGTAWSQAKVNSTEVGAEVTA